jgi:O-antigen/teichoic acid export membrane protein
MTAETHTRRVARNFSALFGGQIVTWTMTLLFTLVVPRLLGPGQFGIINTALSVSGVLLIFAGLGTTNYLVREIVMHPDHGPKVIGTAMVLRLMLSPVIAVGGVVFARIAHYSHEQTVAICLAAIGSIAFLFQDAQCGAFQALERMHYQALGGVIAKAGQSLIGIAVALIGFGALGITGTTAALTILVVGIQAVWLRRHLRVDFRTSRQLVARMARGSMAFWATGVFYTFYLWIDTILLSLMTRPTVVGWYGAATTLVTTCMFLPGILATAWLPRFVDAFKRGRGELLATARAPIELILVASVPIAAALVMAGSVIVRVLYGSAFDHAAPVLVILAFFIPPTYVNMMMNQVLVASGRQIVCTWTMVGAAVANPLFNLVLIPLTQRHFGNGAIGAAISLLLTEALMAVVGFVIVGRHVYDRRALRRFLRAVTASAVMWCVAYAARPLGTPAALTAGVVTLVLLTVALRILTPEEVALLKRGLGRLKLRRADVGRGAGLGRQKRASAAAVD